MFTLAEVKPSSAHWVDGFQFSGEIKTRRMRQYLETREPFSNADDPLSVVIHNNITAAFQLLVFYGPFFGNEDYFTMVLQDMSGDWNPYGWKSRSMMHRLIMRYVSARLTYLRGATESQHIPPDAPDSARKLCRLVDQYRLCVFRPDIMPDLSSDEIKAIRYAWQKAFKEHPRTLLDSPPEMPVHLQQQRLQEDTVGPKDDHSTEANDHNTEANDHTGDNVGGKQSSVTLGKRSRSPASEISSQDWPHAKKVASERRVRLGRMYGWRSRQDASVPGSSHDGLQPLTPESTHAAQMTAIKNEAPNDLTDRMPQAAYGKKPMTPSLLLI
jgi:hypothetical protein